MAIKGTLAKENVINKIKEAFGDDYIGIVDKKVYLWGNENGEKIQICVAFTCPKQPIAVVPSDSALEVDAPLATTKTIETSKEEEDTINNFMKQLGLL